MSSHLLGSSLRRFPLNFNSLHLRAAGCNPQFSGHVPCSEEKYRKMTFSQSLFRVHLRGIWKKVNYWDLSSAWRCMWRTNREGGASMHDLSISRIMCVNRAYPKIRKKHEYGRWNIVAQPGHYVRGFSAFRSPRIRDTYAKAPHVFALICG